MSLIKSETKGLIIKGVGGFYYVKTADLVLECRAKGIFRRRGLTPLAGDIVTVEGEEGGYVLSEIEERRNLLLRPAVANVGALFIVQSSCDPKPNYRIIDELCAVALRAGIKPLMVLTKTDLQPDTQFLEIYRNAGFEVTDLHGQAGALERLRELASGKISVFAGNSGVGKSTLINQIDPSLALETGETSKKLGRGRHTTRAVELFEFSGGWLADTPGFSSLDFTEGESIPSSELAVCFPDFDEYTDGCAFSDCSHTVEKGCGVLAALQKGELETTRHESYKELYRRAKEAENKW